MKNILVLILFIATMLFAIPQNALAQYQCVKQTCTPDPNGSFQTEKACLDACGAENALCKRGFEPACNFTSICKVYGFTINVATTAAGLLALAMGIYGSFKYLTANGATEELAKAQTVIVNAIIGLVIVVVAYSVTRIILTVTDVGTICF